MDPRAGEAAGELSAAARPPFDSLLDVYERQAAELLAAFESGDAEAADRFKWEHPRFRGRPLSEARAAKVDLDDARLVVAQQEHVDDWDELVELVAALRAEGPTRRFELAAEAVVDGDLDALRDMLADRPDLVRERSRRRHRATLLHYVAANGVEGFRQRTPPNAVEVTNLLLEAGSDPNALAAMYESECAALFMLVSSTPPHEAGLQLALAHTLLDHGADPMGSPGRGTRQSAVLTALIFGFPDTAEGLVERLGRPLSLTEAAGLGRADEVRRALPHADAQERHAALALSAQQGRPEVVRLLLQAGEDPSRLNPPGFHAHATPLHQAALRGDVDVVRALVEAGARLDLRDTIYEATPLEWAQYARRDEVAEYLRERE